MDEANRDAARAAVRRQMADLRLNNNVLADRAHVDPKTVNDFLGRKRRWPNRANRAALSGALGWPSDELDHLEETGTLSPAAQDEDIGTPELEPARSAGELTDEELLAELVYRMRRYRNETGASHSEAVIAEALAEGDVAQSRKDQKVQKRTRGSA